MIGLLRNDGSVDVFFGQHGFISVGSCCCSREWLWSSRTKLCCMATGSKMPVLDYFLEARI